MIDRHKYRLDIAEGSVPDISKESTELKLQGAHNIKSVKIGRAHV